MNSDKNLKPGAQMTCANENDHIDRNKNNLSVISELERCCICLIPCQSVFTQPVCLHAFCFTCLDRVKDSPLPEACPICMAASQLSRDMVWSCSKCTTNEGQLFGTCVYCQACFCEKCCELHLQDPRCKSHTILKLANVEKSAEGATWRFAERDGFQDDMWNAENTEWHGDSLQSDKSWTNGTSPSDPSWSNSNSSDNIWAHTSTDKKWRQSTAKKGLTLTHPPPIPDSTDDDSMMLYSGTDSTEFTSSSNDAQSLNSLYDQSIVPSCSGSRCFGLSDLAIEMAVGRARNCARHDLELLSFYCKICELGVCGKCTAGACANHKVIDLQSDAMKQDCASLLVMRDQAFAKSDQLSAVAKNVEEMVSHLELRYREDERAVRDTFDLFLKSLLDRRQEVAQELQAVYRSRVEELMGVKEMTMYNSNQLTEAIELIRTLLMVEGNTASSYEHSELSNLIKKLKETMKGLLMYSPDLDKNGAEAIAFVSKTQVIQTAVRNAFGYVKTGPGVDTLKQATLKKVFSAAELTTASVEGLAILPEVSNLCNSRASNSSISSLNMTANSAPFQLRRPSSSSLSKARSSVSDSDRDISGDAPGNAGGFQQLGSTASVNETRFAAIRNKFSIIAVDSDDEMSKVIMPTVDPLDFRRKKMEYHCKFGEFGSDSHQFYEPSGVAVSLEDQILVADANNHRIQAFDYNGAYLRTIGQESKGGEGNLVYPNRLTVNRVTGEIIVTERSPTHQVNVYSKEGKFIRKFGANILQHPRGITVDNIGRIIVVECKVMRVVIFSVVGMVLNRFIVDKHVSFPNGVGVNDREEIFISDNRRHGVVVFDYQGAFLRTIGGMGITNYPIGVCINVAGEVVVADNHNNFNVTVFSQDGVMLRALESRVKHAQCFDIALLEPGSIVLSSKDFRVYVYQYMGESSIAGNERPASAATPSSVQHSNSAGQQVYQAVQQSNAGMQQGNTGQHQSYAAAQQSNAAMQQSYAAVQQTYHAVQQQYPTMQQTYPPMQQSYLHPMTPMLQTQRASSVQRPATPMPLSQRVLNNFQMSYMR